MIPLDRVQYFIKMHFLVHVGKKNYNFFCFVLHFFPPLWNVDHVSRGSSNLICNFCLYVSTYLVWQKLRVSAVIMNIYDLVQFFWEISFINLYQIPVSQKMKKWRNFVLSKPKATFQGRHLLGVHLGKKTLKYSKYTA